MDVPSKYAKETIEYFKKQGIHTTLITGDSEMTGKAVAKQARYRRSDCQCHAGLTNKKKIWCDRNGRRWCK